MNPSKQPIPEPGNLPKTDWGRLGLIAGLIALGAGIIGFKILSIPNVDLGLVESAILSCVGVTIISATLGIVMGIKGLMQNNSSRNQTVAGIVLNGVVIIALGAVVGPFLPWIFPSPAPENDYLSAMAYSSDGKTLATGWTGGGGEIRLLDAETGEPIQTLKGHTAEVDFIGYSPDGKMLASAARDQTVRLWDTTTNEQVHSITIDQGRLRGMSFSADGNTLRVVAQIGGVILLNSTSFEITRTFPVGEIDYRYGVTFSPDGTYLGINKDKGVGKVFEEPDLYIWDTSNFEEPITFTRKNTYTDGFAFSPDNTTIAISRQDLDKEIPGDLQLWDLPSQKMFYSRQLEYTSSDVLVGYFVYVTFSPDSKTLAYTAGEYFNVLDIKTNHVVPFEASNENKRFDAHNIVFSPDGTQIAASIIEYVMVWDARSGRLLWQYPE